MGAVGVILFIVYLVLGLYMLVVPFELFDMGALEGWIIFIAGILMIVAGIMFLRGKKDSAVGAAGASGMNTTGPGAGNAMTGAKAQAVQKPVAALK